MSEITVYSFLVPDIQQGTHVPARGKATRKKIGSLHGVVIEQSAEVIDDSLLTETGRYHDPDQKDRPIRDE